jgi:hypothetical protein
VQLALPLHEAEGFAHDLAGGVVASGIDLLTDKLFEPRGQINVQGHGWFSVVGLARIVNH